MEMQQLRHLLAAVKHGNIGRAAQECNITQPALSRSIKKLEQSLGVELLDRGPKGVRLTIFGETVAEYATVILQEAQRAVDEVNAIRGINKGKVSLGITANFTTYLVPDAVERICTSQPGLNVVVTSGFYDDLIAGLRRAQLDLVFGMMAPDYDEPDMTFEPLMVSRSLVHARSDHPLAKKKAVTLDDLVQYGWIMPDQRAVVRFFKSFFTNNGLPLPRQVVKSNSIAFLRHTLLSTGLLSFLPEQLVRDDVAAGSIVKVRIKDFKVEAPVGLIRRTRGSRPPAVEAVTGVFRSICKEQPA